MSTRGDELEGLRVVVTRPKHQAGGLIALLQSSGATPIAYPVIDIVPTVDTAAVREYLAKLNAYDWLVFVSANAARCGCCALRAAGAWPDPSRTRIAAIGPATARALNDEGLPVDVEPHDISRSESLLAMAPFQDLSGKRVLIFRGDGGREALRRSLQARGAHVDYAEVYRRERPKPDVARLLAAVATRPCVIVLTSVAGLNNLLFLGGAELSDRLRSTPILVIGGRQVQAAHELAWRADILTAISAQEDDIRAALVSWYEGRATVRA